MKKYFEKSRALTAILQRKKNVVIKNTSNVQKSSDMMRWLSTLVAGCLDEMTSEDCIEYVRFVKTCVARRNYCAAEEANRCRSR